MNVKINRAIISVSNKTGLIPFAKQLAGFGVEIISTGGTFKTLVEAGINAVQISKYTGFPEIMDGRVKTLHPTIFAGLLARRDNEQDLATMREFGIQPIDMVVVNLYPFEETTKKEGATFDEIVEQIDIGGPSMLRAAAKNFKFITVIPDPNGYDNVITEMSENEGCVSLHTREILAANVFTTTCEYDKVISGYLNKQIAKFKPNGAEAAAFASVFPKKFNLSFSKVADLKYGENSHQRAAYYVHPDSTETSVLNAKKLHGKALSYNNLLDLETALEIVRDFNEQTAVIVKHNNPCGIARNENLADAYDLAHDSDPMSAFGGVIAFNRPVDKQTAQSISESYVECIIAPSFQPPAMAILTKKKNIRLLVTKDLSERQPAFTFRSIIGGLLVQERNLLDYNVEELKIVTDAKPTDDDMEGLFFAWKIAKWVKSNAIVYTTRDYTVGIGAGQMSRVDSANLGISKANKSLEGTYLASDAFFPFRDSIDAAAGAGVRAIIQPGGSVRDDEIIQAANEHGLIMVFTGIRHFRH